MQLVEAATHLLERQGQASSAGSQIQFTTRTTHFLESQGQVSQQGPNPAHYGTHSQTGEPRTGIISRVKIQPTTKATHLLESQGQASSAGSKSSSQQKPLTT